MIADTHSLTQRARQSIGWPAVMALGLSLAGVQMAAATGDEREFGDQPELVAPQVAFQPSAAATSPDTLTINFDILDGYYLYRDKTRVTLDDPGIETGDPVYSAAITITDDFFGDMATHRDSAWVSLPLGGAEPGASFGVSVTYQGCADIGICFPPTTETLQVSLPDAVGLPGNEGSLASFLGRGSQSGAAPLLSPDEAYRPAIVRADAAGITLQWDIEPGYYLYRDKFAFRVEAGDLSIARFEADAGTAQYDEFYGDTFVLRERATVQITPGSPQPAPGEQATLLVDWQGCADVGVCFPPTTTALPVSFSEVAFSEVAASATSSSLPSDAVGSMTRTATSTGQAAGAGAPLLQSEQDRLSGLLGSRGLWLNALTFFGLGLLLAFTPCVLPMIPILSSLIVGQGAAGSAAGKAMNTGRAFRLSAVYVLVMATTYALVGVVVGLTGYNVQPFLQNPWVLSGIALLFVVLAVSMFGFFELQMPVALQQRLTAWSNRQRGGEIGGVALMGFISTLIVGPCVTAPLAGALIYIANTGDAVIGGVALFALGLGMGAPLLLIGTSAGHWLPRAGVWMQATRNFFGILLLAMAIWMLSRFLPSTVSLALAGALAIMVGVHMGATDTLDRASSGWQRFGKGSGLVLSLYGAALLIGALAGGGGFLAPLKGLAASGSTTAESSSRELHFRQVKGLAGVEAAVNEARAAGQTVMLDFYADWCVSCKEMEAFTFTDDDVQQALANTVLIQADVTANDALDQALLEHFQLFGPPAIIFYDNRGVELPAARVVGFMQASDFTQHVERAIGLRTAAR